ncbi:hypothetical protein Tco_0578925 [Tanacetum coccineum]
MCDPRIPHLLDPFSAFGGFVGEHVVDTVSEHLDFMPCGATTLTKHVVEVVGNGSNPGGGFGKPGGGLETRSGGDGI